MNDDTGRNGLSGFVGRLIRYVDEHNIQTISFDVFDTIVFRRVSTPRKIFEKCYRLNRRKLELSMTPIEYAEMRIFAEKNARMERDGGEVSLCDIFDRLPLSLKQSEILKNSELDVERENAFVLSDIVDCINLLKESGKKVILISDMYLSGKQIRDSYFGTTPELMSLPLFVSSEEGVSKRRGELFSAVKGKLGLSVMNWLHIGDNRISDVLRAKEAGLHSMHFGGVIDAPFVVKSESGLTGTTCRSNSARLISTRDSVLEKEPVTFEIGSLVFGPVLSSFADFIIENACKNKIRTIYFLMREANIFLPVVSERLQQKGILSISIKKLHVSRKSTFWASIDTNKSDWIDNLLQTLISINGHSVRGYTVADFYRDMFLDEDEIYQKFYDCELKNSDSEYFNGKSLLSMLHAAAKCNSHLVINHIKNCKDLLRRYYQGISSSTDEQYAMTVDFGNGGTIQNYLESALSKKFGLNVLFYSSSRIYRFKNRTNFISFISNDEKNRTTASSIKRSVEVLEPLFVGYSGTTLGYRLKDGVVSPIQAKSNNNNRCHFDSFLRGILSYMRYAKEYSLKRVKPEEAKAVLDRFIQFPTIEEALVYCDIYHEDNFGVNRVYPVISDEQLDLVRSIGIEKSYLYFNASSKWMHTKIHWPQGAITMLDSDFLVRQAGLVSTDTEKLAEKLIERIDKKGWRSFIACGAGLFFKSALPDLMKKEYEIKCIVDKQAEFKGEFTVEGNEVVELSRAFEFGSNRFVIFSSAFKDEIASNIYRMASIRNTTKPEIISL